MADESEEITETTETKATSTQATIGKTFSEDYVKTVREEAKENRIARKTAEAEVVAVKAKLKKLIGLKDTDDLDDTKIAEYQTAQEAKLGEALKKANDRLLQAEIKSLEGYDAKLVDRLLDKSKVTIADDGTITGLTEAVKALETEFPAIKIATAQTGSANPPIQGSLTEKDQLIEQYNKAEKQRNIPLMNQLMEQIKKTK